MASSRIGKSGGLDPHGITKGGTKKKFVGLVLKNFRKQPL
jgi:hypothetical protein